MENLGASWVLVGPVFVCGCSPHVQNCLYWHRSLFGFLDPARDWQSCFQLCRPCLRTTHLALHFCARTNSRVLNNTCFFCRASNSHSMSYFKSLRSYIYTHSKIILNSWPYVFNNFNLSRKVPHLVANAIGSLWSGYAHNRASWVATTNATTQLRPQITFFTRRAHDDKILSVSVQMECFQTTRF